MAVVVGATHPEAVAVPTFFNGRVLSAEDLRLVLQADRKHRALLGRTVGAGVADGLRVTRTGVGLVQVSAGVAVNQLGEVVHLAADCQVSVSGAAAPPTVATSNPTSVFTDCGPSAAPVGVQNAFVLTVRPDSIQTGSAPADPYLAGESCGPGFVNEGARFRRVPFDPTWLASQLDPGAATGLGGVSQLSRNVVGHLFLGTRRWIEAGDVGATASVRSTLEAAHALIGIQPCEVTLAVFYLQGSDVALLDEFSVRRPCRPDDQPNRYGTFVSAARHAAGLATLAQFQEHLAAALAASIPGGPRAGTHFRYLPAAGVLPGAAIGNPATHGEFLSSSTVPFFSALSAQAWIRSDRTLRSARVESVLRDGAELPPIDTSPQHNRGLPIMVIPVHESLLNGNPYAVFISRHHPYRDHVELRDLADAVAELRPVVEDPHVKVTKVGHEHHHSHTGHVVTAQYRVTTNRSGSFTVTPVQQKLEASLAVTLSSGVQGGTTRHLSEGSTTVTVQHRADYSYHAEVLFIAREEEARPIPAVSEPLSGTAEATIGSVGGGGPAAASPATGGAVSPSAEVPTATASTSSASTTRYLVAGGATGPAGYVEVINALPANVRFGLVVRSVTDASVIDQGVFDWTVPS